MNEVSDGSFCSLDAASLCKTSRLGEILDSILFFILISLNHKPPFDNSHIFKKRPDFSFSKSGVVLWILVESTYRLDGRH